MIRFLPPPYPDELLWSVFARAARRLRFPSHGAIAKLFSGSRTATSVFDLPSGLDEFCAQIGSEYGRLDATQLISQHTMLPLYAPFLCQDQLEQIEADMRGNKRGAAIHLEAGIMASRVRSPAQMRYCPKCVVEDFNLYSESYWRRTHQAPGVEVCPTHAVFLEASSVQRTNRQTRHAYIPVPSSDPPEFSKRVDMNDREHVILLEIAQDVGWLLNENLAKGQVEDLRRIYRDELAARKLAVHGGRMRLAMLNEEVLKHYSPELLMRLQCSPSNEGWLRWLPRLLRTRRAAQAPIYHLLFVNFLGTDTRNLFARLASSGPFGPAGWPCLNPICEQYKLDIITCHEVGQDDRGVMIGTFLCKSCGYLYVRRGPDRDKSKKNCVAWVAEYGQYWKDKLKCYWADSRFSLRAMARRLGVDPLTVKRMAAKLDLPFPRLGKRIIHRERVHKSSTVNVEKFQSQRNYRMEWQASKDEYPHLSRSQLRRLSPDVYMWLYRHDRDRLIGAKLPDICGLARPAKSHLSPSTQNWIIRDCSESFRVHPVAMQIRNEPGKPKHISKTALARRLGILAWVQKHAEKMPLTIKELNRFSETRESFALRRIAYALASEQWRAGEPTRWRLMRLAGIRVKSPSNRQFNRA